MRRRLAIFLAIAFLAGCGGNDSGNDSGDGAAPPPVQGPGSSGVNGDFPPPSAANPGYNGGFVAASGGNVVPVYFESGSSPTYSSNIPYVDVQVCMPGTTRCVTIDHVQVDTGSTGLRVMKSALSGLDLPVQTNSSDGSQVDECMLYATSEVWGPVVHGDLHVGGEAAANLAMQVIDDGSGASSVPASCSSKGALTDTVESFGGKGIIGISQLFSDSGDYYACSGSSCSLSSTSPVTVTNPVAAFDGDNNGVSLQIPPVSDFGAPSVVGQLIFGIGTHINNQIAGAAVLYTDGNGYVQVGDGKNRMLGFVDSGTASYFFPTDGRIPICSDNAPWYCPPSPLSVDVDVLAVDGSSDRQMTYRLSSADGISQDMQVAPIGESGSVFGDGGSWYVLGLPFYFNRRVYGSIQHQDGDPMYYAL
ncbi:MULTISPECIES: DUF3443 family protein [Burkholderia cepacia complex]|uniref:DUF3443 family protein n=1 Tax=Burkholderia cepacia complex TaxID=87882 RepID=UPI00157B4525|nr:MULTISPECIES: DUF3443 family protein [Burkholderia cepacia complex]NTY38476.1 DUF3443 family protein [Burkholderia diffusa]